MNKWFSPLSKFFHKVRKLTNKKVMLLEMWFDTAVRILAMTKLKAYADEKSIFTKMMFTVFDRVENIVGKGENSGHQHFLLFPRCFQKLSVSVSGVVKAWDCVVKN